MRRNTTSVATALRQIARDFHSELRRLNGSALEGDKFANATRRTRAKIVRERLKTSYRDRSPCC